MFVALICYTNSLYSQSSINVDKLTISDCFINESESHALVQVELSWSNIPSDDEILVSIGDFQSSLKLNYPSVNRKGEIDAYIPLTSPQVMVFEVPADGSSTNLKIKHNNSSLEQELPIELPASCHFDDCQNSNSIGGQIYFKQSEHSGQGLSGIHISLEKCDNSGSKFSTVTDSDGNYSFNNISDQEIYQIVFDINTESNLFPASVPNNRLVRTISGPSCDVDLSLTKENSLNQDDSDIDIFVSCYVHGVPDAGSRDDTEALLTVPYNGQGYPSAIANASEVGSLWGIAWDEKSQTLYSSTVLRRHSGFGPLGVAGLYTYKPGEKVKQWIDLSFDGALNFGDLVNNDPRGLSKVAREPAEDELAWYRVGKIGIGDIDLSDDGKFLFVTNLANQSLIKLEIDSDDNPNTKPQLSDITEINIPNPCGTTGVGRPWGLHVRGDKVFVGVTCDASLSDNSSDLRAFVYSFDIATNSFEEAVLDFPLTYPKGSQAVHVNTFDECGAWRPWNDDYTTWCEYNGYYASPQPILSDIDFTSDGSMILGFIDRSAYMLGADDLLPDGSGYEAAIASAGDILMANKIGDQFFLENRGISKDKIGQSQDNFEGPGGGEFFEDSYFLPNGDLIHSELAFGAVAVHEGLNEMIYTAVDPEPYSDINFAGGIRWHSTEDGSYKRATILYRGTVRPFVGKSAGLGDLELATIHRPTIEIGDYVFLDQNRNGLQDPCDTPIVGIKVCLNDADGNSIATTTTDEEGHYNFTSKDIPSLSVGEKYILSFACDEKINEDGYFESQHGNLTLTTNESNGHLNSDAILENGQYSICFEILEEQNDYSYDVGFVLEELEEIVDVAGILVHSGKDDELCYAYGDTVKFSFISQNQGNVSLDSTIISVYLPKGLAFDPTISGNEEWSLFPLGFIFSEVKDLEPGKSDTSCFYLVVKPGASSSDWLLEGEVSQTFNANGTDISLSDIDSPLNFNKNDNYGGLINSPADNYLNGNGTAVTTFDGEALTDQDNADPEQIKVYDLALRKVLSEAQTSSFSSGEKVEYIIEVHNQGNQPVQNIAIIDYGHASLVFDPNENDHFELVGEDIIYRHKDVLLPDDIAEIPITFTFDVVDGSEIINSAEIVFFTDINGVDLSTKDADSTPDAIPSNDKIIDDEIRPIYLDENGIQQYVDEIDFTQTGLSIDCKDFLDEDDSDIAQLGIIDLGLNKTIFNRPKKYGDTAIYIISVINEGAIPVKNTIVTDFKPKGLDFSGAINPGWAKVEGDNLAYGVKQAIYPGEKVDIPLLLVINSNFATDPLAYLNIAEISYMENLSGVDISDKDIDSQPDANPYNDVVANGAILTDLELFSTILNSDSEDDHDTEFLAINDLSLSKEAVQSGPFEEGDDVEYILTVRNEGNQVVDQVVLADYPPNGLQLSQNDYVGWLDNQDGSLLNVIQGAIRPGEEVSIPIVLSVVHSAQSSTTEMLTNKAEILDASDANGEDLFDFDSEPGNIDLSLNSEIEDDESSANIILFALTPVECGSLSTRTRVNVSMGNNCQTKIIPSYIFTGNTIPDADDIVRYEFPDTNGMVIIDSIIPDYFLNQCVEVTAFVDCTNDTLPYSTVLCLEDKDPPNITCPENDTLSCVEASQRIFTGLVADCSTVDTLLLDEIEDDLSSGPFIKRIEREWQLRDALGNTSSVCSQTIMVRRLDFVNQLSIPTDTTLACEAIGGIDSDIPPTISGQVTIEGIPLGGNTMLCNTSALYTDRVILDSPCKRITMRTWTINEWRDGQDSIIEPVQLITVIDTVAPELTMSLSGDTMRVNTTNNLCSENVLLPAVTVNEACNPSSVKVDMFTPSGAFLDQNGGMVSLPVDTNHIYYSISDGCHNIVRDTLVVIVTDAFGPLTVCHSELEVAIPSTGSGTLLSASSFDFKSVDACGGDVTKLVRHMDSTSFAPNIFFDCDDIGETLMVVLQVSDQRGNANTCMISTTITGDISQCVANQNVVLDTNNEGGYEVGGLVFNPFGVGIPGVSIDAGENGYVETDYYGNYYLGSLGALGDYDIHASFESDFGLGVSTLDLIKIQRHILGIEVINDPHSVMAADINFDGQVNAIDLVLLRKYILGFEGFSSDETWMFVSDTKPEDPMGHHLISSLNSSLDVDFVGIKVGDVTGDAIDDLLAQSRSNKNIDIVYDIIDLGGFKEISFIATEDMKVSGLQWVLNYNPDVLKLRNVNGAHLSLNTSHFNTSEPGVLTSSWAADQDQSISKGDVLWRVLFESTSGNEWNYNFSFSSRNGGYIKSEIYIEDEVYNVALQRATATVDEVSEVKNSPNPWLERTKLAFELPRSGMVELELYDAQNRLVFAKTKIFEPGSQNWVVSNKELSQAGVYFGKLSFEGKTRVFKMIKIE